MGIEITLLFGFVVFWLTLLLVSNLFQDHTRLWFISAGITGITTIIFGLLNLTTPFLAMIIAIGGADMLLVLVKWISGSLK